MKSKMVVVADSCRARFFTIDSSNSPLHEIKTMAHPEGRLHEQDMVSDLPGKNSGTTDSNHAYQQTIDPKQEEIIVFSKRITDYLEDARKANKIRNLYIVAAPSFLGELRKDMSTEINKMISFELDKNLTQHNLEDIRKHLPKHLTH